MSGNLVHQYVEDLESIIAYLRETLDKGELTKVDHNLSEAYELVSLIELSRPPNVQAIVGPYKKELATFKKQVDILKHNELTYNNNNNNKSNNTMATQILISENHKQRLDATSKQLQESMRVAHETEEIARNTLEMLHTQREQMEGMHTKLDKINDSLDKSAKELSVMERRNKIFKVLTFGLA